MARLITWLSGFSSDSSRKPDEPHAVVVDERQRPSPAFGQVGHDEQAHAELVARLDEKMLLVHRRGHLRADDLRDAVLLHDLDHLVRATQARVRTFFEFPRVVVAQDAHGAEAHVGLAVQPRAERLCLGDAADEERFSQRSSPKNRLPSSCGR